MGERRRLSNEVSYWIKPHELVSLWYIQIEINSAVLPPLCCWCVVSDEALEDYEFLMRQIADEIDWQIYHYDQQGNLIEHPDKVFETQVQINDWNEKLKINQQRAVNFFSRNKEFGYRYLIDQFV